MDLLEFLDKFPGENECLDYFIATRLKAGITCPECGGTSHKWVPGPTQFECNQCGNRINIKIGTVMEKSKLSIKHWFVAIQLLTSSIDSISIEEILKKNSGADQNEVFEMLQIIRYYLNKLNYAKTFDQLLLACVDNQPQIPKSKTKKQSKLSSKVPSKD